MLFLLLLDLCLPAAVDVDSQILTFPEIMMFSDFAESGLVLKARPI
jgi:hypothetical protein